MSADDAFAPVAGLSVGERKAVFAKIGDLSLPAYYQLLVHYSSDDAVAIDGHHFSGELTKLRGQKASYDGAATQFASVRELWSFMGFDPNAVTLASFKKGLAASAGGSTDTLSLDYTFNPRGFGCMMVSNNHIMEYGLGPTKLASAMTLARTNGEAEAESDGSSLGNGGVPQGKMFKITYQPSGKFSWEGNTGDNAYRSGPKDFLNSQCFKYQAPTPAAKPAAGSATVVQSS